jgi:HEAT repeat protein
MGRLVFFAVAVAVTLSSLHFVEAQEATEKVKQLSALLKDPDSEKRVEAAKGLSGANVDARPALDDLIDLLRNDKIPDVRVAAARALSMVCYHRESEEIYKKVVPVLVTAMQKDEDTLVRWAACRAFVMIGPAGKDAAPALLELMSNKDDPRLRELAGHSLSYVASPQCAVIVPKLIEMHNKGIDEEATQINVLAILGKVGSKEDVVVPILLDVINEKKAERWKVRYIAALALGDFGPKAQRAVPSLIACIEDGLKYPKGDQRNISGGAIEAIGRIGAREAIPILITIIDDPKSDDTLKSFARRALTRIRMYKPPQPKADA